MLPVEVESQVKGGCFSSAIISLSLVFLLGLLPGSVGVMTFYLIGFFSVAAIPSIFDVLFYSRQKNLFAGWMHWHKYVFILSNFALVVIVVSIPIVGFIALANTSLLAYALCNVIILPNWKYSCFDTLQSYPRDSGICYSLSSYRRNDCFYKIATHYYDIDLCDMVQESDLRSRCYHDSVVIKAAPGTCDVLELSQQKECYRKFDKQAFMSSDVL
jgi:hypothetical protein